MWLLDKFARRLLRTGEITVIDADGTSRSYGRPDAGREPIVIRFLDGKAADHIARHPRLGAAEVWMDGRLVIERGDIASLIDLIRVNGRWEKGGQSLAEVNR